MGSDSKNGVRHQRALSPRLSMMMMMNHCNLQLKPKKASPLVLMRTNSYTLSVIFHNLKNYDSHFVIKHFEKRFTEKTSKGQKVTFDDIKHQSDPTQRRKLLAVSDRQHQICGFFSVSVYITRKSRVSSPERRQTKFSTHHQIFTRHSIHICQRRLSIFLCRWTSQVRGDRVATYRMFL